MGIVGFARNWAQKLQNPIFLDFPVKPRTRWGFGQPYHAHLESCIAAGLPRYAQLITELDTLAEVARAIPMNRPRPDQGQPFWNNVWISAIDALSIMHQIRQAGSSRPNRYFEVGSGMSTRFARHVIRSLGLKTQIISVDPAPRVEVDRLCDQVIRKPLEDCDPEIFRTLEPGDVLFIDNSHRALQNSDVTYFFLEALPRLKPGVTVGLHDIFLPADYPPEWHNRYYSEQYLLATWLLARRKPEEILFPIYYCAQNPETRPQLQALLSRIGLPESFAFGGTFWMVSPPVDPT